MRGSPSSTTASEVSRKTRLDAELVRRGLARSRQHAVSLVTDGRVSVGGLTATKVATAVDAATPVVVVAGESDDVVSRGAHKLAGALDAWLDLVVEGRRCLDAGASTGGFTQVLLRRGAASVVAVDVGYGQLAWSLRTDDRVIVHERTNVRELSPQRIGGPVDLVVADLSFISLTVVLPALRLCLLPTGDAVLMVKPQFEAGRDLVGSGGVVRDAGVRTDVVMRVAACGFDLGLGTQGVVASPLPGPSGNVEYFLWLREAAAAPSAETIRAAVEAGPQ
jgi:23S rRNA (cytidine1920-2'-O)/16S rRNA (cytidine1409-2'-O)-methyltransferase